MRSTLTRVVGRPLATSILTLAACAVCAGGASAALTAHGQLLRLAPGGLHANAAQSTNWFGYVQGTLEQGGKLFNSISGDWTVPTATQHTAGQAEASSDWIGIGGGCIESTCAASDPTLIQTGTEQDVSASGAPSYSAWWELVPVPSLTISNMSVSPGDRMHATIAELVNDTDLWTITLQDLTKGQTFTQTVPYPSTHLTAEWIEETPLQIGTNAGFSSLPNLSNPAFDSATTNGASANLKSAEQIQLTDSTGKVIGTPSAPDAEGDGFANCSWASVC
jgi:hypothetical protein